MVGKWRFCWLLSCLLTISAAQAYNVDSLLNAWSQLPDSVRCDSLVKVARQELIENRPENTIELARRALRKAHEEGYKDIVPKARFYLAAGFDEVLQPDSCLHHYKIALEEMKGTAHADWKAHVYVNISNYLRDMGNYEKALEYRLALLEEAEKENDTFKIAHSYTDIGYIYDRMKDFREAIKWHRQALPLFRQLGEDYAYYASFTEGRIGIAYDDLGMYDSAHYYNFRSLEGLKRLDDAAKDLSVTYSNIGNTYSKQGEWKKAEQFLQKAYELNYATTDIVGQTIVSINLGHVYSKMGQYERSLRYLREGMKKAAGYGERKFLSEANYRFYELYEMQGRMDSALYYYKTYKTLEDSLYNAEKSKQIADMRTRYETDKKEQQIGFQQLELQGKESTLRARRNLNWVLALGILLILLFSVGFYYRYRAKKNAELQQAIILEKEKGLKAVIHAQEEERKRIAKDLHDGIGQQLSGLKMGMQSLEKELEGKQAGQADRLRTLTDIVHQSAEEVRSISHQMMPRVLTELGLVPALQDMLSKSLDNSPIAYEFEHLNIDRRFDEKIELSLYRVCQELINNVIKHSHASKVHIQLLVNKAKVILIVEDNGQGMSDNTDISGHGLMNIKSRLSTIEGEVNYEKSPGSGTLATIRVPLK